MRSDRDQESLLLALTDVQREAALWNEGAMMLLAGPGSGKTRVLTARIARLFKAEPSAKWRILALTFTTRAADEMRQRVEELVPECVERMFAGTFHSFACEVLRQSGSHVGVRTDFKIYSSLEDRLLLLSEALMRADLDIGEPLDRALPVLDGLRDRLAGPDDCLRYFSDENRGKRFASAYDAYMRHLQAENALDFPAIIYMAYRLFTSFPVIADRYRRTYRFTSLDEFQDTNHAQYSFVRAFTGNDYKNLFVVADDDQVIYQWNGASPQRLQQFVTDYDPSILQMPTNFRCPSDVVLMANGLVSHNLLRTPGKNPLVAGKAEAHDIESVRLLRFESDDEEAAGVAADLAQKRVQNAGDVAIIARTKNLLVKVQGELAVLGIASQISQRRDSFASVPYQWLHCCLKIANRRTDPREFAAFVEAGNVLLDLKLEADDLVELARSAHGDFLRAWASEAQPLSAFAKKAVDILRTELVDRNDFRKFVRGLTELFAQPEWTLVETQPSFEEDQRAWRDLFTEISGQVGRLAPLDTFLQELDLRSKEPPMKTGVVPLLTIHGSKGNEFPHVYLMGLAEDVLPSFQSKKAGDRSPQMEEERRNCFVAITRCKDTLTLSYARVYNGWAKAPSRFLREMAIM
ncbi:ATP-dependent helicase [Pseudotabrizicola algicola]|uniref:DNA 3'-5' helicase n=1 Tax=Pseudotabrizicola algicola TaxID=2709381 RepID=A0A6B3RR44_9RHOB|nr:ATP-dependent helicase [Pseudotabrizicola algicola]NEX48644.1 ATP-dependent helicase [Pseudotabrizicola algicola]